MFFIFILFRIFSRRGWELGFGNQFFQQGRMLRCFVGMRFFIFFGDGGVLVFCFSLFVRFCFNRQDRIVSGFIYYVICFQVGRGQGEGLQRQWMFGGKVWFWILEIWILVIVEICIEFIEFLFVLEVRRIDFRRNRGRF